MTLERLFDAEPEVVFDAFNDPEAQKELYADGPECPASRNLDSFA
jgi:uncharacterized protein YndB with AHSA1/START domain